jgi:hypothetical protein
MINKRKPFIGDNVIDISCKIIKNDSPESDVKISRRLRIMLEKIFQKDSN